MARVEVVEGLLLKPCRAIMELDWMVVTSCPRSEAKEHEKTAPTWIMRERRVLLACTALAAL